MIKVEIDPDNIPCGKIADLCVRFTNDSDVYCAGLHFRLHFPSSVLYMSGGMKSVDSIALAKGASYEHHVKVKPKQEEECFLAVNIRCTNVIGHEHTLEIPLKITKASGGTPVDSKQPNVAPPEPLYTQSKGWGATLYLLTNQIAQYFDNAELRMLCLRLSVDYENLSGENKLDKSRSLIEYCNRHGTLPELLLACFEERPHVKWPEF